MESWYYEKIVYRQKSGIDDLISFAAVIVALAVCIVSFYFLGSYSFVIWLAVVYGAYRIITSRRFDYEYIFVEDTVSMDKIINKARRKNLFTYSLKDFEIIAYKDSEFLDQYKDNVQQVIDCTTGTEDDMFALAYYQSKQTLVYFESDERIMEFIEKYAKYKYKE